MTLHEAKFVYLIIFVYLINSGCTIRKTLTLLPRLVMLCVVIPPLIVCMVRVKHVTKSTEKDRESDNVTERFMTGESNDRV